MAERKRVVEAGQRFGRLEVVDPERYVVNARQRVRAALVRCDCGTARVVVLGSLLRGATQSCGCLNAENRRGPKLARRRHHVEKGQVFGDLVVLEPDRGYSAGSRCRLVGVRCSCGAELEVPVTNLTRLNSQRCMQCSAKKRTIWDRSDPDWQWRQYLWNNYHITAERYLEMLETQGGVCAICQKPPGVKRLHVDHDHACCPRTSRSCGKCVRGLLCFRCNTVTGVLELHGPAVVAYLGRGLTEALTGD